MGLPGTGVISGMREERLGVVGVTVQSFFFFRGCLLKGLRTGRCINFLDQIEIFRSWERGMTDG